MAGLSVRTVQRAENGAPSGIETLKSLAAVFEVSLDTLRSEQTHTQPKDSAEEPKPEDSPMQADATPDHSTNTQTSKLDATKIPASLRPIIRRSVSLLLILAMLTFINLITVPQYLWVQWPALGFGIAIISMWVDWLMQGSHTQEQDNSVNRLRP